MPPRLADVLYPLAFFVLGLAVIFTGGKAAPVIGLDPATSAAIMGTGILLVLAALADLVAILRGNGSVSLPTTPKAGR